MSRYKQILRWRNYWLLCFVALFASVIWLSIGTLGFFVAIVQMTIAALGMWHFENRMNDSGLLEARVTLGLIGVDDGR